MAGLDVAKWDERFDRRADARVILGGVRERNVGAAEGGAV